MRNLTYDQLDSLTDDQLYDVVRKAPGLNDLENSHVAAIATRRLVSGDLPRKAQEPAKPATETRCVEAGGPQNTNAWPA